MGKAPQDPYSPVHPAKKLLLLTLLFIALACLFGFITVFVPWVQKDIAAINQTFYFYPFRWCLQQSPAALHYTVCESTDFGGFITGQIVPDYSIPSAGNQKCRDFYIAIPVNVFSYVILGVVALVLIAILLVTLWSKLAVPLMCLVCTLTTICAGTAIASFVCAIILLEEECANDTPLALAIWPVQNYSYGFIMTVFAAFFMLCAMVLSYLALMKILKTKQPMIPSGGAPVEEHFAPGYPEYYAPPPAMSPYMSPVYTSVEQPMYPSVPVYAPMEPMSYPTFGGQQVYY